MSFFQKLLGGTFESNKADGDESFAQGYWGPARLSYDRALSKGKDLPASVKGEILDRIATCRHELALLRIRDADDLAAHGELERAREMLDDAVEICDKPEILEAVVSRRRTFEADAARGLVGDVDEMTEEELLAVIAGTWTEGQAEEYAALPDAFRDALVLGHDREFAESCALLEGIRDDRGGDADLKYFYFEFARHLAGAGRLGEALEGFSTFLAKTQADRDAAEVQVAALTAMGRIHLGNQEGDLAVERLREATRLTPGDHRPYLNLGVVLRQENRLDESLVVLARAIELMGQMNPDFTVVREMGFTYLALGKRKEAKEHLFAVIEHHASAGNHDQFDPEAAVPLAALYEEDGEIEKAADLYRHLAVGYDARNHFAYNLNASRLLAKGGGPGSLVERYLARAAELAEDDSQHDAVDTLRAEISENTR